VDGIRVDERDLQPEEALTRSLVDQIRSRIRELGKRRPEVADLVGDVVHAGPSLGEKPADRRVLLERFEQLDAPGADPQGGGANALIVDDCLMLDLRAEKPLVRAQRLVEVRDCDAEMMDPSRLHRREAI
jgi:hypothetical protein